MLKQTKSSKGLEAGFTLIELLVTLAILAVFYGLVVANFAVWRGPQFVRVSANELATNVSKARSYALSARNVDGNPAKMYVVQFSTTAPNNYKLQALESTALGDVYKDPLETIVLPGAVYVQDIVLKNSSGTITHPTCLQLAFSLPYGSAYMNPACDFNLSKTNSALDALGNAQVSVVLARSGIGTTKTIVVDGVSGRIEIQ